MKLHDHRLWAILGIVFLAVGSLFLVPYLVEQESFVGQAAAAPPADYVAKWTFDESGDAIKDATGGVDGNITAQEGTAISRVPVREGKALEFKGNGYVTIPYSS